MQVKFECEVVSLGGYNQQRVSEKDFEIKEELKQVKQTCDVLAMGEREQSRVGLEFDEE